MEKYLGDAQRWAFAENILREIVTAKKTDWFEGIGEAAFYGPKLDFMGKDAIGRLHQVATIQLDVNMPERFDLFCINENGEQERIVMIHAAIMGSIERFLAVIIEHFAGAFPLWLAPVQVAVLPVSDKFSAYGKSIRDKLTAQDIRSELGDANESLGKRIRAAEMMKVPYVIVVGEKEEKAETVNFRTRGSEEKTTEAKLDEFIEKLKKEIKDKKL
jgi:threonyl-tRNA synthetase